MTPMVVYDCQVCGKHSARKLHEMPWHCDHCDTDVAVSSTRDVAIIFVPEAAMDEPTSIYSAKQTYTYSKEIFTERGVEAYEVINA